MAMGFRIEEQKDLREQMWLETGFCFSWWKHTHFLWQRIRIGWFWYAWFNNR
jgi:hypothetical protein